MTTTPLAQLMGVTKRFGAVTALDNVDLTIPSGEILGVLGPNGAGKSTAISLIAGLLSPTQGTVRLMGADPRSPAARVALGVTPQDTSLPGALKVREVIDQVAAHFPDPVPTNQVLHTFQLADLAGRQTAKLSGGQRRRLAVGLATVGRPRLMILDEPTTGLDTETRAALWQVVRDAHAAGTTIVLTSHYLEEIEALAHRVVLVDHGHILLDDTLAAVLSQVNIRYVTVHMAPDAATRLALATGAALTGGSDANSPITFLVPDSDAFVRALVATGEPFRELTVRGASLEEAVAAHTASATPGTASGTMAQPLTSAHSTQEAVR